MVGLQQCLLRAVVTAAMTRGTKRALTMISLYQEKKQPEKQRCDSSADTRGTVTPRGVPGLLPHPVAPLVVHRK